MFKSGHDADTLVFTSTTLFSKYLGKLLAAKADVANDDKRRTVSIRRSKRNSNGRNDGNGIHEMIQRARRQDQD